MRRRVHALAAKEMAWHGPAAASPGLHAGECPLFRLRLHGRDAPFYFVAGEITPEHFDFHVVVPHTGPENKPGGWQEACVHARMRNFKTGQSAVCHFQPGVPIVVESRGRILPRDAKVVAAVAANRAARTILGGGTAPGIACDPFRKLMAKLMRDDGMPGARVAPCNGQVPAVYFDPER